MAIDTLDLRMREFVNVRIGVINVFGRNFGNYPQDIVMNVHYF